MKAKELIALLEIVEPETELGVSLGYRRTDLKSMETIGGKLYFNGGNWAKTEEDMREFDVTAIINAVARLARKDDSTKVVLHEDTHDVSAWDACSDIKTLEDYENDYIAKVLERCGNNKRLASTLLGISERTIHRKLRDKTNE